MRLLLRVGRDVVLRAIGETLNSYKDNHMFLIHLFPSMEAALAELGLEDLTKDAEDDNDFVSGKGVSILLVFVFAFLKLCPGTLQCLIIYRRRRCIRVRLREHR